MRRLSQRARPESFPSWCGVGRAFLIQRRGERFRVRYRSATLRNAFSPLFYGIAESEGAVTRIRGEFRAHPLVRAFAWLWFSFVAVVGAALFFASVLVLWRGDRAGFEGSPWLGLVAGPCLLLIGLVLVLMRVGWASHQHEITRFLMTTTEASVRSDKTA